MTLFNFRLRERTEKLIREEREFECERQDLEKIQKDMTNFLMKSSKYYLEILALFGDKNPTIVHRFAALLIQNIDSNTFVKYSLVFELLFLFKFLGTN